jgi:hypothetical protein
VTEPSSRFLSDSEPSLGTGKVRHKDRIALAAPGAGSAVAAIVGVSIGYNFELLISHWMDWALARLDHIAHTDSIGGKY